MCKHCIRVGYAGLTRSPSGYVLVRLNRMKHWLLSNRCRWLSVFPMAAIWNPCSYAADSSLRVLFLGDTDHHKPADRFKQIEPELAEKGIAMTYTEDLADLNPAKLAGFDCLMIFANHTRISPEQE